MVWPRSRNGAVGYHRLGNGTCRGLPVTSCSRMSASRGLPTKTGTYRPGSSSKFLSSTRIGESFGSIDGLLTKFIKVAICTSNADGVLLDSVMSTRPCSNIKVVIWNAMAADEASSLRRRLFAIMPHRTMFSAIQAAHILSESALPYRMVRLPICFLSVQAMT
jgi:hypothetical protein